jgi:hypothetical protein
MCVCVVVTVTVIYSVCLHVTVILDAVSDAWQGSVSPVEATDVEK